MDFYKNINHIFELKKNSTMKHIILIVVIFTSSLKMFSQEKHDEIIFNTTNAKYSNCSFSLFNPPIKIKALHKKASEVKNGTIEELLTSLFSATDSVWKKKYYINQPKFSASKIARMEKTKKMDKEKNFMQISSWLKFNLDATPIALVKVAYKLEEFEKPVYGMKILQKVENEWLVRTSFDDFEIFEISFMMLSFKDELLKKVFIGKPSDQVLLDELLQKVYTNGELNLGELVNEYKSWKNEANNAKREFFKGDSNWKQDKKN